jgi:flagellar biosynthesis protein FlhG
MSVTTANLSPFAKMPAALDQAEGLRDLVRQRLDRAQPAVHRSVQERAAPSKKARVIAVTSGKGGVGKTNIAVNLSSVFASAGKNVVLLDADMGLANADVLCGLDLPHNLAHVVARRKRLEDVLARAPGGFRLAAGATGLARMADLPQAEHDRLMASLTSLEDEADLLVIDTGAGISPNVLNFTAAADQVLVVTTPEPTAVTDAYATIKVVLRERAKRGDSSADRVALLVNQARNEAEGRQVFERVAKVAAQFLGASIASAGCIPHDAAVTRAVRQRMPFTSGEPGSSASRAVESLAIRLERGVAQSLPRRTGFFGRVARATGLTA